jgi:hypothetical protein
MREFIINTNKFIKKSEFELPILFIGTALPCNVDFSRLGYSGQDVTMRTPGRQPWLQNV